LRRFDDEEWPVPALPSCLTDPIWEQVQALIPDPEDRHPLGCHRPRIPDRVVFDLLINALVFGAGYRRIADPRCSATTLRRRRDEWIAAGVMNRLERAARDGYDKMIGLDLGDVAVDGCLTKAPCGGEVAGPNPTDRGKLGIKRSTLTDAGGLPLAVISAPANRGDSPLLAPTLDVLNQLGPLPERTRVHLDAGYDSGLTRSLLAERGLTGRIARKGLPAPVQATKRWPVERTHAWHNTFYRLARCTERRQAVADFYIALANAVILVRRLLRTTWATYRWDTRPSRKP
jgi:transposase